MADFSDRMTEVLELHMNEFDPYTFRHEVADIYQWFPEEFERLIRAGAFTPSVLNEIIFNGFQKDAWDGVDYLLREMWHAIYPNRIFPYDEPGVAPPEFSDSTDERGVSRRLARLLAEDYRRNDPTRISAVTVGRTVQGGGWSWLPRTLETQIKARALTRRVWAELIYDGDPSIDESTVDRDLRELWAEVAPGRPYPLDVE